MFDGKKVILCVFPVAFNNRLTRLSPATKIAKLYFQHEIQFAAVKNCMTWTLDSAIVVSSVNHTMTWTIRKSNSFTVIAELLVRREKRNISKMCDSLFSYFFIAIPLVGPLFRSSLGDHWSLDSHFFFPTLTLSTSSSSHSGTQLKVFLSLSRRVLIQLHHVENNNRNSKLIAVNRRSLSINKYN